MTSPSQSIAKGKGLADGDDDNELSSVASIAYPANDDESEVLDVCDDTVAGLEHVYENSGSMIVDESFMAEDALTLLTKIGVETSLRYYCYCYYEYEYEYEYK